MLYLVATPIGNRGDITQRAIDTLRDVDIILCEDTRTSRPFLAHLGIKKPTQSYHDYSSDSDREKIISLLKENKNIALISDAGSPLISDPGYKLIKACQHAGVPYTTIPGASSVIAALQLSGLPSDEWAFYGFLPTKKEARKQALNRALSYGMTSVFFETANRLEDSLVLIKDIDASHSVSVVREITKLYEEVITGSCEDVLTRITQKPIKGEVVLVIAPHQKEKTGEGDLLAYDDDICALMGFVPARELAKYLAGKTGLSVNQFYERITQLKNAT